MSRSPYHLSALTLTLALGACTIIIEPGETATGTASTTTGTTAADTTADMSAGTTTGMTLDTDPVVPTTSGTTDAPETSSTGEVTTNPMPCTDIEMDVALDDDFWTQSPQWMLDTANAPMGTLSDVNAVETALTLTFTAPTGMGHLSGVDCPDGGGLSYELFLPIELSFVTADGVFNEVFTGELLEDGSNDMTYTLNSLDVLDVMGSFMPATVLEPMGFAQGDFDSLHLEVAMDTFMGGVNLSGTLNRVACMGEADCYRTFTVGDIVREP
ncbi:MAG: hypothetical protein H0T76_08305 [Nannocystis sp.]|nr:hypothetical protein [Nannocystis sp.]MBA3546468.1 hypothetical protein [Nannocystis sp.]